MTRDFLCGLPVVRKAVALSPQRKKIPSGLSFPGEYIFTADDPRRSPCETVQRINTFGGMKNPAASSGVSESQRLRESQAQQAAGNMTPRDLIRGATMTEKEKLLRDMKTLFESIRLDWQEIGAKFLTPEDCQQIKRHIQWCLDELKTLYNKLK